MQHCRPHYEERTVELIALALSAILFVAVSAAYRSTRTEEKPDMPRVRLLPLDEPFEHHAPTQNYMDRG